MPFPRSQSPASLKPIVALAALAAATLFATTTVTIAPGDTLTALAAEHGVTVAELVEWNDIAEPDRITAGDVLFLSAAGPKNDGAETTSTPPTHVVTAGETLWLIARRYGASVAELAAANNLSDPDRIVAGNTLVLAPVATTTTSAPGAINTHTVVAGETIFGIALHYRVKPDELAAANGISDPNLIRIDQVLIVPGGFAAPPEEPGDENGDDGGTPEPAPTTVPPTTVPPTTSTVPDEQLDEPAAPSSATPLKEAFSRWSASYGVPQDLLEALAWKESNWQPSVTGPNGELGIGQLDPETVVFIEERLLGISLDPLGVSDGIQLAARYLRYLIDRTHSDREALAAWHQGLISVLDEGVSTAAGEFADQVLEIRRIRS